MCSVSLQKPDNIVTGSVSAKFLRLDVTFPEGIDQVPTFEVSKSSMMSLATRNQIQVKLGQIFSRSTLENPIVECFANLLSLAGAGGVLAESVLKKVASQVSMRTVGNPQPPAPTEKIATGGSTGTIAASEASDYSSGSSGSEDQIRVFRGIWNDVRGGSGEAGLKPSSPKDLDGGGGRTPRKSFAMEGLAVAGTENLTTFVPYPRLCGAVFSQTGKLAVFYSPLPHPKTTKFSDTRGDWGHSKKFEQTGFPFTTQPKMLHHYAKYREFLVEHGARSVISNIAKNDNVYPTDSSAAGFLKGLGILSAGDHRSRNEKSRQKFDDWFVSDSDEENDPLSMPFWRERKVCDVVSYT
jgi:hypothetical protein